MTVATEINDFDNIELDAAALDNLKMFDKVSWILFITQVGGCPAPR
jgi:hypothetical protein